MPNTSFLNTITPHQQTNPASFFTHTPEVKVSGSRGFAIREIAFYRQCDAVEISEIRITRHRYDARGYISQSADPRLHQLGMVNFSWLTDLHGNALRTRSADAGSSLTLNDTAGRPLLAITAIGLGFDVADDYSESVTHSWQYENASLPGRRLSITEEIDGEAQVVQSFQYADNSPQHKARNLAGLCVSRKDPAGEVQIEVIALTGTPQSITRTPDKDMPGYRTLTVADATGTAIVTTDAAGNQQRLACDVAGRIFRCWLTPRDSAERAIVTRITYDAAGRKLQEKHGNGLVRCYEYHPRSRHLTRMRTSRPDTHPAGAKLLQDLRYIYDPVGNVLSVRNDAEVTRYWRNQKVEAQNNYAYDSLYQLVRCTGREQANANKAGRGLNFLPPTADDSAYTRYSRAYSYDTAGNLIQIRHSSPATDNSYTTRVTVSNRSNRAVLATLAENSSDVESLFTAGGQQKQLRPGQSLEWTPRGELSEVVAFSRDEQESYRYDGNNQRIIKTSKLRTGSSNRTHQVIYLPGLELRTTTGSYEMEKLQVMCFETAQIQVRVLHWETGKPSEIDNNQLRYSYDNLTGSSALEADGDGNIISMEEYYPHGGTALYLTHSQAESDYKTIRYSGKERDASGLYYYGYRYYQPWAGRWLSADPAGTIDGVNLYRMVQNNPVTLHDSNGLAPDKRGTIYAPFAAADLVDQSLGMNSVRHRKGKSLYPVIVSDDVALQKMEQFRAAAAADLKSRIDHLSASLQSMESTLKSNPGWTADTMRNSLNPATFDKMLEGMSKLSQDLVVANRLQFLNNQTTQALSRLSPDNDKLYIIGHGGAGMDILAADQQMSLGMITAESLAEDLDSGGLDHGFQDIRVTACYSADADKPASFEQSELDRAADPGRGLLGWLNPPQSRKAPFAKSLRTALSDKGFSAVPVTGYHGAGVTFASDNGQTRRLPGVADVRRSKVKRMFL